MDAVDTSRIKEWDEQISAQLVPQFLDLFMTHFLLFQYENEVKILSKWTHNKLARAHFSDSSGDVSFYFIDFAFFFLPQLKVYIILNDPIFLATQEETTQKRFWDNCP